MPIASLEPSASTMISRSLWRSRPALVSFDHITPDDTMTRSVEMSQRSGSASSARRIGLANASPTIDIELMPNIWTCRATPRRSNWRPSIVVMEPPTMRLLIALKRPVPCISGAAGMLRGPGLPMRSADRLEVLLGREAVLVGRVERAEQVVLTPHDALGHAGGAAGVEQQEVVAAAAPRRGDVLVGARGGGRFVRIAHSGHGPLPSSTHSQERTLGTRDRIASHCRRTTPWNTTATTSALSQR